MTISPQSKKKYDHRLRKLVHETGDISIALRLGVPRSTASAWRKTPPREVITRESFDLSDIQVQSRIQALELQVGTLGAIVTLLLVLVRIAGARLSGERLPEGEDKDKVIRAIERAVRVLPLRSVLRILGLGSSRYHAWTRSRTKGCPLDDRSSCPKTHPAQLLPEDLRTMRDLATSADYRHVPTGTLAILAQRLGKVFASPSTWLRHVRERGWRRPRKRVHPDKPTEGIRTDKPDGLWHIDVTVIRLLDGTKTYLQAIIDNYSRRILAWRLDEKLAPMASVPLLLKAFGGKGQAEARHQSLMVDGGVENFNQAVDDLCEKGILHRILAQTDIFSSNSMIEAFWRALKHHWLFLNNLDSSNTLRRLVEFYVREHNESLPHSALKGRTPDEMYFGTGEDVPERLRLARIEARAARLEANRRIECETCKPMAWEQLANLN